MKERSHVTKLPFYPRFRAEADIVAQLGLMTAPHRPLFRAVERDTPTPRIFKN